MTAEDLLALGRFDRMLIDPPRDGAAAVCEALAALNQEAPGSLPATPGGFVGADISVESEGHPSWRQPARIVFRRDGDRWTLVGLERLPEKLPGNEAAPPPSR